ncbi:MULTISPECIES: hypothetical protein [Streptomyces]|uniref:hypothetical protein n=1 Tax=Streptomyces TaxID=1883 RepID=UPI00117DE32C|nr:MULTISPECIES: hypothetical protein [Streptomyces]
MQHAPCGRTLKDPDSQREAREAGILAQIRVVEPSLQARGARRLCRCLRRRFGTGRLQRRSFLLARPVGCPSQDEVYARHVNRYVVSVVSRLRIIDTERCDCRGPGPAT